jgi:hypothetical protein
MPSVVSIAKGRRPHQRQCNPLLEFVLPNAPRRSIGVLLRDSGTGPGLLKESVSVGTRLKTLRKPNCSNRSISEDSEVEPEEWVKAPPRLRLTPDMFVARVVDRSMEARIPDGSLCVFRAGVVGSREGKLVLVERFGTKETSARYTIEKYTSRKVRSEEGECKHAAVRLEPLNPEFDGFELKAGEARVTAEFIQVLE